MHTLKLFVTRISCSLIGFLTGFGLAEGFKAEPDIKVVIILYGAALIVLTLRQIVNDTE